MERTGGPVGQLANWCRMMARWTQQLDGEAGVQDPLIVDAPLKPSSYIQ